MLFLGQMFDGDQCEISIILNFGGNYFKLHILIAEECVNCHGWHGVNLSFKDVRHFNCDFSKYHRVLLHIYEQPLAKHSSKQEGCLWWEAGNMIEIYSIIITHGLRKFSSLVAYIN